MTAGSDRSHADPPRLAELHRRRVRRHSVAAAPATSSTRARARCSRRHRSRSGGRRPGDVGGSARLRGWRDATPSVRQRALLRIADAIEARGEEIVAAECENTGKPIALTMSEELPPMVDQIRFFAGAARVLEGRAAGEYLAGHTSFIRREPVGVCAQVTPWNYPMMMAVWKWAPAIAAGNAVVLKPSDTTPVTTLLMAEIMAEFLPPGVINVVCGERDTGRLLVEHPTPSMVSITGSVRAGMEVAGAAARDLKRVHLELGGKAPVRRVRRRRPGEGGGGHCDRRLLQCRPGLHRGDSGARGARHSRRLRRCSDRAGAQHGRRPAVH